MKGRRGFDIQTLIFLILYNTLKIELSYDFLENWVRNLKVSSNLLILELSGDAIVELIARFGGGRSVSQLR